MLIKKRKKKEMNKFKMLAYSIKQLKKKLLKLEEHLKATLINCQQWQCFLRLKQEKKLLSSKMLRFQFLKLFIEKAVYKN